MKTKMLMLVLVAGVLGASAAIAAPPPGKGKPTTGAGCKPMVTIVLKGVLATTPGPTATSLSMTVKSSNRHGRAYVQAGPTSVLVNADTKVRRQGKKTLGDLLSGDRVLVQARACKADLANGAKPPLTAVRVVAHPAA